MTGSPITDVEVRNEGTIWLLIPLSNLGEDWLDENLVDHDQTTSLRFGRAYAVEHRYVGDILEGMGEAGLRLR